MPRCSKRSGKAGATPDELETRVRILSVDGGGMRGLVPALVLVELERLLHERSGERRPLSDYFHLFAGTSTGGLISLALVSPTGDMTAERLVGLYRDRGESIFPTGRRWWRRTRGYVRPKFDSAGLKRAVEEEIGPAKMSEALRDVVITAYDMTEHRPQFFKRAKSLDEGRIDHTMVDVAMATASAPTYLPPWPVHDSALVDGGVFVANPTIAAIAEALKREIDPPTEVEPRHLFVVSLGTGFYRAVFRQRELSRWGALQWIKPRGSEPALMRAMLDGQTASADHWAHMLLNHKPGDAGPKKKEEVGRGDRYYRIEAKLEADHEMDDARGETLDALEAAARRLIAERGDDLDAMADKLVDAGPIPPLRPLEKSG